MELHWTNDEARLSAIQVVTARWTPNEVFELLGGSEVTLDVYRAFENSLIGDCQSCGTPTPIRQLDVVNNDDVQRCVACLKSAT